MPDPTSRVTLGYLLKYKPFVLHAACVLLFLVTFSIPTLGNFWLDFYEASEWATIGLIAGNYLGMMCTLLGCVSWVVVDDNNWLGKALNILQVGVCLTISSSHFIIYIFKEINQDHYMNLSQVSPIPKQWRHKNNIQWLLIFIMINFFQGIVFNIYFITLCLVLDKWNLKLM